MAKLGSAFVVIKANLKPLKAGLALAKKAVAVAMRGMSKIVSAAADIAKKAMLGFIAGITAAVYAAAKQQEIEKRLAVVLKSTAGAAGLSHAALLKHAAALERVTTFGDEAIIGAQALLLTFKDIKGDVFNRTTELILDMSVALGQDLKQGAIQVGKALNDPILGITALSRVGVTFTEDQKEMIKTLVKSGKVVEAQALILTELESEFGGMSRVIDTFQGALLQMKNAIGTLFENVGKPLLEPLTKATKKITKWAQDNEETVLNWGHKLKAIFGFVGGVLLDFATFMQSDWKGGLDVALNGTIGLFQGLAESISKVWSWIIKDVLGNFFRPFKIKWMKEWDWLKTFTVEVVKSIGKMIAATFKGQRYELSKGIVNAAAVAESQLLTREVSGYYEDKAGAGKSKQTLKTLEKELAKIWKSKLDAFVSELPEDLREDWQKRWDKLLVEMNKTLKVAAKDVTEEEEEKDKKKTGGAAAAKGKVGFMGLIEAWKSISQGMNVSPELKENKKQTKLQQDQLKEQKKSNQHLKSLAEKEAGTLMTGSA